VRTLALIPARGGSKRIPRKNVLPFCGKPILAYSVEAAQSSGLFDEIMVSTDDPEIARVAEEAGASVPFLRSPATADDHSGLMDVVREVLVQYRTALNQSFDVVCCLLPTAPLIQVEDLTRARNLLEDGGYASVLPVVRFGYPILRSLNLKDGKVSMNWPEYYHSRSQDLPPAFHDAGQFYWIHTGRHPDLQVVFTANSGAIELDESKVQDIDTLEDWKLAELKYKMLNSKGGPLA